MNNQYGFTDVEWHALNEAVARFAGAGVGMSDLVSVIANFGVSISDIQFSDPFASHAPDPDPRQVTHDRSKRDRRQKARAGKYRWGGVADE